jgi:hypothetical protein
METVAYNNHIIASGGQIRNEREVAAALVLF